jgi:hypothetical protein
MTAGIINRVRESMGMRKCTRKDFSNIGAEKIYDKKYKANEEKGYLLCPENPKEIIVSPVNMYSLIISGCSKAANPSCDTDENKVKEVF